MVLVATFLLVFWRKTEIVEKSVAGKLLNLTKQQNNASPHYSHLENCTLGQSITKNFTLKVHDTIIGCFILEYVNANKLQQDHPCVLEVIRRLFLNKPSPPDAPLRLDHMEQLNPSAGQVTAVQRILRNLVISLLLRNLTNER